MRYKRTYKIVIVIIFLAFVVEYGILKVVLDSKMERLNENMITEHGFRRQEIGEEMLEYIKQNGMSSEQIGLYLLESKFGYQDFQGKFTNENFDMLNRKWRKQEEWNMFQEYMSVIWDDLKYFPIPLSTTDSNLTVSYGNSWMNERTYGGKRGHEGTDIMAAQNIPGLYPVISMTDGVIRSKGWLEKGGWRIGVEAPSGAYFYYAHLDSYASVEIGDKINAGDLLGFMGDSGYGAEGTTGQFPVHLHVGVYIYSEEKEVSINPYWLLRYLEKYHVKCAYSSGDI